MIRGSDGRIQEAADSETEERGNQASEAKNRPRTVSVLGNKDPRSTFALAKPPASGGPFARCLRIGFSALRASGRGRPRDAETTSHSCQLKGKWQICKFWISIKQLAPAGPMNGSKRFSLLMFGAFLSRAKPAEGWLRARKKHPVSLG